MATEQMFTPVPIPADKRRVYQTGADRNRAQRRRDLDKGIQRRGGDKDAQAHSRYLRRQFIAWDGEGVSINGRHDYVLLASSVNDRIIDKDGLKSALIFDTLLECAEHFPKAIHVIYGGGYDFNSWVADLPREMVEALANDETIVWGGYLLSWRMGRYFQVKRGKTIVKVYDVVPFFQCPFVKACDEYLGDRFIDRAEIVASKARRGTFTFAEIKAICTYNDSELANLVNLVVELRLRLDRVGIQLTHWYGPGSIASVLFKNEGVRPHIVQHDIVAVAERTACSAGRFEIFKHGYFKGRTYQYDINSAYPSAMRYLPSLQGEWQHRTVIPRRFPDFSLVHASWAVSVGDRPGPLWVRNANGTLSSPRTGEGWYWGVEMNAAMDYVDGITASEWFEYRADDPDARPFHFIKPMFMKRRALKAAGDGAHVGIKLGLNSMFGKTAQQIGWRIHKGHLILPPFHTLSWAGFTTAHCRANILRAITLDPDAIIATETDAVFSRRPLPLDVGTGLGQWEKTEWLDLVYIQSGFYSGTSDCVPPEKNPVVKSRGVDKGTVTYDDIFKASATGGPLKASLTRYVGARLALAQGWDRWRTWETSPKEIKPSPQGKRVSSGHCRIGETFVRTLVPFAGGVSYPYPVEWINPSPAAHHLAEMRAEHYVEDYE